MSEIFIVLNKTGRLKAEIQLVIVCVRYFIVREKNRIILSNGAFPQQKPNNCDIV
jgi:hypothetical protein